MSVRQFSDFNAAVRAPVPAQPAQPPALTPGTTHQAAQWRAVVDGVAPAGVSNANTQAAATWFAALEVTGRSAVQVK